MVKSRIMRLEGYVARMGLLNWRLDSPRAYLDDVEKKKKSKPLRTLIAIP
jgi:hypothetical protein